MKTILTFLALASFVVMAMGANKIVYSEDFENATVTETTLGNGDAKNFGGGADWVFALETNYPISGSKSAYFNVKNAGSDWWTLQYRIDSKFPVFLGKQYKISFKIQSSVANELKFKVEATANFTQVLQLKGGYETESFSFVSSPMDRDGDNANFMFAFGAPTVPGEIWLDDIVIEEVEITSGLQEKALTNPFYIQQNRLIVDEDVFKSIEIYNLQGMLVDTFVYPVKGVYILNHAPQIILIRAISKDNKIIRRKVRMR